MINMWKMSDALRQQIYKYAKLPQTGVSLRQMVEFGPRPNQGTLFHASYFAVHELPIRLSHRVRELENLPIKGLSDESSIKLVRDWYAQSFEELTQLPEPDISDDLKKLLLKDCKFAAETNETASGKSLIRKSDRRRNFVFDDDGIIINRNRDRKNTTILTDIIKPENVVSSELENKNEFENEKPVGLKYYFQQTPNDIHYPREVVEYNKLVTKTLIKIKKRHDATVSTLASGVQNWKNKHNFKYLDSPINQFLDRFYLSRIGIRMLIGQTISINQQSERNIQNDDYVGIISLKCNIKEIIEDAIDASRFACEEHFNILEIPDVKLYCPPDLVFRYVPGHLVHMVFETLKNSLRATIEHHSKLNPNVPLDEIEYPPIKIIVAKGDEDITIKISDEGGGIPRSVVPLIWTYFYTSAHNDSNSVDNLLELNRHDSSNRVPFMGLGVGLPHSRLYARYFSGDLKLISMEGYGTDVYIHLNRLSGSTEPLV